MRRLFQVLSILFVLMICGLASLMAGVFIVTGQDPLTAAERAYLRFTLSRQQDVLLAPAGRDEQSIRFVVEPGTPTRQIATNLLNEGLITDADLFVTYTVVERIDNQLEAGTYFLSNTFNIPEIAYRLTDSNSSQIVFRILEGWRKEEIAAAIDQNGLFAFTGSEFMNLVDDGAPVPPDFAIETGFPVGNSLEGFLFPDTYQLPPDITALELRDLLLTTFSERITPEMAQDAALQGYTLYEIVTLASIAEREAVHDIEHALITSVYRNRLEQGIRLDADPTIQYALDDTRGRWWSNITRADYRGVISPYNTYLNDGLPPTPISNPGISAIRAAIYPIETDFIFFRAACDNSGYHEFAHTYDEHLANGCRG